ncbi:MAG: hypothetical protein AB1679_34740, partial [Actinomycetota bacterium]
MDRLRGFIRKPIVLGALIVLFSSACAGNQARLREEALRAAGQAGTAADGAALSIPTDQVASSDGAAPAAADAAVAGGATPAGGGAVTATSGPAAVRSGAATRAAGSSAGAA